VRKAWTRFTAAEKDLFISAVSLGMKRGFHHRFVELHMETASEYEAHGCLFFFWHRAMLLGYENMLRSLDPAYKCVTMPFWDYATVASNFIAGSCSNMLDCSPILQDYGGSARSPGGIQHTINGGSIFSDSCVRSKLTENFCQSETAFKTNTCYKCIPRSVWSQKYFPPEVDVTSIFNQIMGTAAPTLAGCNQGLQYGAHNNIHATLMSAMGIFASPADPIFYAHHATVDALHSIYHKCTVGGATVAPNDPKVWSRCTNSRGREILTTDTITMNIGESGTTPISVWSTSPANVLAPFFAKMPNTYPAYADTKKLPGDLSYSYDFTGTMFSNMWNDCKAFSASKKTFLEAAADPVAIEANWYQSAHALASKYFDTPQNQNAQVEMMLCVYYN